MGKQVHSSPTPLFSFLSFLHLHTHILLPVVSAKQQIAPELKNTTTIYDPGPGEGCGQGVVVGSSPLSHDVWLLLWNTKRPRIPGRLLTHISGSQVVVGSCLVSSSGYGFLKAWQLGYLKIKLF